MEHTFLAYLPSHYTQFCFSFTSLLLMHLIWLDHECSLDMVDIFANVETNLNKMTSMNKFSLLHRSWWGKSTHDIFCYFGISLISFSLPNPKASLYIHVDIVLYELYTLQLITLIMYVPTMHESVMICEGVIQIRMGLIEGIEVYHTLWT